MSDNRDYTKKAFSLTFLVIIFLVGVSFIPPFKVGNVVIKRANILSDIIEYDDSAIVPPLSEHILDTSFLELFKEVQTKGWEAASKGGKKDSVATIRTADPAAVPVKGPTATVNKRSLARPHVYNDSIVRIEDFSEGQAMMSRFYHALAFESAERPVRIAVLGDSFIEADIITADLREQLQLTYGGSGVGFVPFSTPLSKYRGTIKHTHDGWDNHNIIKHKSVPEEYKDKFFVSGMLSIPKEGASVEYKGVRFRDRIESANTATLLFANRENSSIAVTVNDSVKNTYTPPGGDRVECIRIKEDSISNLGIRITDAGGFIGYGVVLEDSVGVSVHNFSVRSNSGMALFGTSYEVNTQINDLMNYDLIILQYGLNAMSPDVTDYNYYGRQLCRMIEYIKKCFPGSAILVMSVGDRSTLKNGTAVTMPAVKAMLATQRNAAKDSGVGFWNTFEAMGGDNSMPVFVERKWASKDHTHIGYPGGKYIAGQLVSYLNAAVESIREQETDDLDRILDGIIREGSASPVGAVKHGSGMISIPTPGTYPAGGGNGAGEGPAATGHDPADRAPEPVGSWHDKTGGNSRTELTLPDPVPSHIPGIIVTPGGDDSNAGAGNGTGIAGSAAEVIDKGVTGVNTDAPANGIEPGSFKISVVKPDDAGTGVEAEVNLAARSGGTTGTGKNTEATTGTAPVGNGSGAAEDSGETAGAVRGNEAGAGGSANAASGVDPYDSNDTGTGNGTESDIKPVENTTQRIKLEVTDSITSANNGKDAAGENGEPEKFSALPGEVKKIRNSEKSAGSR